MTKTRIKENLKSLGFSEYEAIVYVILLEIGLTSAGEIIKKTGFHRNVIYTALDRLIVRKYVSELSQKGVKHYKANDPERILSDFKEKFDRAKVLMPELKNIKKSKDVEILIYEDIEGFRAAHGESLKDIKKNDVIYVIGGRYDFYKYMGDNLKQHDKERIRNNIRLRVVGFRKSKEELNQNRPLAETRYLRNDYLSPVGTSIYGNNVLIQIYSEPTMVIRIRNREVADSYRNYFNIFWNMARN